MTKLIFLFLIYFMSNLSNCKANKIIFQSLSGKQYRISKKLAVQLKIIKNVLKNSSSNIFLIPIHDDNFKILLYTLYLYNLNPNLNRYNLYFLIQDKLLKNISIRRLCSLLDNILILDFELLSNAIANCIAQLVYAKIEGLESISELYKAKEYKGLELILEQYQELYGTDF